MHYQFFCIEVSLLLVPEYTRSIISVQDAYTWVLENTNKGKEMTPERYEKVCTAIYEHAFSLAETIHVTVAQLAQAARERASLQTYITSLLEKHNFTTQVLGNERLLICGKYTTDKTKTLLLFNSCPPQDDAFARWSTFVTRLMTFAVYHKTIGSIPLNIVWLIDTEEHSETDDEASRFIEENSMMLQDVDGCLYDLPHNSSLAAPFLALGTKGLLSVEMEIQTATKEHHTMDSAIVPDAAWRLAWALSSLKDVREEILIGGFYDTLVPMEDEEIALLRNMSDDEQVYKQRMDVNEFLLQLHGFQLRYTHLLLPTCTVTSMQSGRGTSEIPHTIPSFAKASLDIHLVPDQEPEDIYAKLRQHLDTQGFQDVQAKVQVRRSPHHTSVRNPFVQVVCDTARAVYGEKLPILPLMLHIAPYYPFQSRLNIPVVYTQIGYFQEPLSERDTVTMQLEQESSARFLIHAMKHLAIIIEDMSYATDTTW